MKKKILICHLFITLSIMSCTNNGHFRDAVAYWSLSGVDDKSGFNSSLKTNGNIDFIALTGNEKTESKARGGDGRIARFKGGWLDAGQGIDKELNIDGKGFSMLIRMKPENPEGFVPLFTKSGTDQSIAYAIALNTFEGGVYIEATIGSDDIGGAHKLRYKLPADSVNEWHDILFRFNGKISELYVDGFLRDDEVTVGDIRDWNRRPVLIGGQYKQQYGYAEGSYEQVESKFEGLIDHVVLWNSYVKDDELAEAMGVDELKDGKPEYYSEKYRPQFHFSARKNWLNDPNGLVYYNGVYHMFFQYMPPHRPGAYKDWGHAISTDLVHWEQVPNHITPHKVWSGCWSGSAVVDENNVAGFQQGDEKTIIAFITNGGNPDAGLGPKCTQCIAYSTDGGNTFTYYDQNPIIKNVNNANRDPKVVWDSFSQKWIMSLYMDHEYDFGLFSSSDLKHWEYLSTSSIEGVAECPGFEALPVDGDMNNKKWLFFGANGNYVIGDFDGKNFHPETKVLRGDYGKNFYAAQTWSNAPDGRCIHIAWMPTKRYPGMPFEQQMNFPTELTLRETSSGIKVFRLPVSEIRNLYDQELNWKNVVLTKEDNVLENLDGELYDMEFEIDPMQASSFTILARGVSIHYDVLGNKLSCGGPAVENTIIPSNWQSDKEQKIELKNNLGEAPLNKKGDVIKLRVLIDRTTIEVFGNDGEVVVTSCIMPEDENKSYSLLADDEIKIIQAEVHSLKSTWIK